MSIKKGHFHARLLKLFSAVVVTSILVLFILRYLTTGKIKSRPRYDTDSILQLPRENRNGGGRGLGPDNWNNRRDIPHLAVAICGQRLDEPLTMLKSAVLFTKTSLVIHVFSDTELLQDKIKMEFESWPSDIQARMVYKIYNASFPVDVTTKSGNVLEWKTMYGRCATQRLFIADTLRDVDSILYVDADSLFLAPVEELWSVLYEFNSTQFVAAVSTDERPHTGLYHSRGYIPFYGPTGINAGILLLNLTRLRASTWLESVTQSIIKYGKRANLADQDCINIYLHDHPENGYLLTCDWNYRERQCAMCEQADQTGVAILHGCTHAFVNDHFPPFKAIYSAFKQFILGKHDIGHDLVKTIKQNINKAEPSGSQKRHDCQKDTGVYTKRLEGLFKQG